VSDPFDVPDCPDCENDVFVQQSQSPDYGWVCLFCEVQWDQSRYGGDWGLPSNVDA